MGKGDYMTADPWVYFVLGLIAYQILKMLALAVNVMVIEHRKKRFLNLVNVKFPGNKNLTFISIDASDKRSMAKMESQLREQFHLQEDSGPGESQNY